MNNSSGCRGGWGARDKGYGRKLELFLQRTELLESCGGWRAAAWDFSSQKKHQVLLVGSWQEGEGSGGHAAWQTTFITDLWYLGTTGGLPALVHSHGTHSQPHSQSSPSWALPSRVLKSCKSWDCIVPLDSCCTAWLLSWWKSNTWHAVWFQPVPLVPCSPAVDQVGQINPCWLFPDTFSQLSSWILGRSRIQSTGHSSVPLWSPTHLQMLFQNFYFLISTPQKEWAGQKVIYH